MALSFTPSFFIGWAVGLCTISLVIAIIVLTLRGSARGASVFALLRLNHKSDGGAEGSTKQTAAATNAPTPEDDPLPLFTPNPITWQHRELHERLFTVVGPKGIKEEVGFEGYIDSIALKLVYGGQNPAIEPTIMPTIDNSMFDDRELIRLAGNPPEGETWSELISDRDTRYYAIWTFLIRLIYKRMHPTYNKVPSGDYNLSDTGHLSRDLQECLLPPEVTSCLHLIPDRYRGLTEDLVSVWRETLLMLLMPRYKLIHIPSYAFEIDGSDPRQKKIDSMASEIADVLNMEALDACRRPVDVVKKRLANELGRAANAALIFFGQPSEWEVDWTSDPGRLVAPRIRFMWNGQVKWSRPGAQYPGTPWNPIEVEKFEE